MRSSLQKQRGVGAGKVEPAILLSLSFVIWTFPKNRAYSRLASLCRLVVGEDDEKDDGQLHVQHPLHRRAPLWTQHKVDEHGENVVFERILLLLGFCRQ